MLSLWFVGLILVALFSGCVGVYAGGYKIELHSHVARIAVSTLLGTVTFLGTSIVVILVIWPPFLAQ